MKYTDEELLRIKQRYSDLKRKTRINNLKSKNIQTILQDQIIPENLIDTRNVNDIVNDDFKKKDILNKLSNKLLPQNKVYNFQELLKDEGLDLFFIQNYPRIVNETKMYNYIDDRLLFNLTKRIFNIQKRDLALFKDEDDPQQQQQPQQQPTRPPQLKKAPPISIVIDDIIQKLMYFRIYLSRNKANFPDYAKLDKLVSDFDTSFKETIKKSLDPETFILEVFNDVLKAYNLPKNIDNVVQAIDSVIQSSGYDDMVIFIEDMSKIPLDQINDAVNQAIQSGKPPSQQQTTPPKPKQKKTPKQTDIMKIGMVEREALKDAVKDRSVSYSEYFDYITTLFKLDEQEKKTIANQYTDKKALYDYFDYTHNTKVIKAGQKEIDRLKIEANNEEVKLNDLQQKYQLLTKYSIADISGTYNVKKTNKAGKSTTSKVKTISYNDLKSYASVLGYGGYNINGTAVDRPIMEKNVTDVINDNLPIVRDELKAQRKVLSDIDNELKTLGYNRK